MLDTCDCSNLFLLSIPGFQFIVVSQYTLYDFKYFLKFFNYFKCTEASFMNCHVSLGEVSQVCVLGEVCAHVL